MDTGRFVKLTLGKSRNRDTPQLKNIYARPVMVKDELLLQLTYRFADRDEVKNLAPSNALQLLSEQIGGDFLTADLFTLDEQLTLVLSRKGKARINQSRARHQQAAIATDHNRSKVRHLQSQRSYLHSLGITDSKGEVLPSGQKKYKQINKFVEIIDKLVQQNPLTAGAHIVDMGSGKGYLTFALYDHLANTLGLTVRVTGVELRPNLVEQCNTIAQENGFSGLSFIEGYINSFQPDRIDMLIALHACDTATDDALLQGIRAGADLLVVAPCCQKQVRKDMEPPAEVVPLLRHGIMLERQAAMLTDALRALYLEELGYRTKVFEFIALEHTAKNVMITAAKGSPKPEAAQEIDQLKNQFGIQRHYLEERLAEI